MNKEIDEEMTAIIGKAAHITALLDSAARLTASLAVIKDTDIDVKAITRVLTTILQHNETRRLEPTAEVLRFIITYLHPTDKMAA